MLKIKCFIFNPVAENTYIVWDDESLECAVIDAGCYSTEEKKELQEYIERENLKVKYLLATHLHFDHVFGNTFVSDTFGARPIVRTYRLIRTTNGRHSRARKQTPHRERHIIGRPLRFLDNTCAGTFAGQSHILLCQSRCSILGRCSFPK